MMPPASIARRRDPAALPGQARDPYKKLEYLKSDRVLVTYDLPFNEVVLDFVRQAEDDVARLRVAGLPRHRLLVIAPGEDGHPGQRRAVDALSIIVHKTPPMSGGRALAAKMRELIPRQMFEVGDPGVGRKSASSPVSR